MTFHEVVTTVLAILTVIQLVYVSILHEWINTLRNAIKDV